MLVDSFLIKWNSGNQCIFWYQIQWIQPADLSMFSLSCQIQYVYAMKCEILMEVLLITSTSLDSFLSWRHMFPIIIWSHQIHILMYDISIYSVMIDSLFLMILIRDISVSRDAKFIEYNLLMYHWLICCQVHYLIEYVMWYEKWNVRKCMGEPLVTNMFPITI